MLIKVGLWLLIVQSCELWALKPKLSTSQIWTLLYLISTFITVFVCAKSSKLIILEQNIVSFQQPPLCLPLFYVFSSEVLNSGIKSCFDEVVFQVVVCEECFSIHPQSPLLVFVTVFKRALSLKLFYLLLLRINSFYQPSTCISLCYHILVQYGMSSTFHLLVLYYIWYCYFY